MIATLAGVRWDFIVVLVYVSLVIGDAEYLSCSYWSSLCLLWGNLLFRSSAHFLSGLFVLMLSSVMNCL